MTTQEKYVLARKLLLDFKEYVLWIHKIAQGSNYDMTDAHARLCDKLQEYAEGRNKKRNLMVNVSPGCFAGDTVIGIRREGRPSVVKYTLKELWDKQQGNTNRKNRAWRKDKQMFVCSYIDHLGKISNRPINLIEDGGLQRCLRVDFEGGHITGTPEHRVLTREGWKRICELVPGDELASCGNGKSVGKQVKYKTRTIAVWNHPYARTRAINGKTYQEYPFQRCVYEANASGLSLNEYLSKLKANDLAGIEFLDKRYHIHHINGDHYDNRAENLKAVTAEQHARIHDVYSNLKTHTLVYKKVLSVEDAGEQETYCIMLDPAYLGEPSFLANDVFVHNFGKSLLIQYFITWCFARSKHCMFCYIAYGERLIKKLSRESRNLMMMPEWEELFGKEMDPGDKSVLNYHLISGGVRSGLTAGTISSAILGLDAGNPSSPDKYFTGALILDDINSPEVVRSVHEQIEAPETYQRKLATRRRMPTVPTICIMQRHCFTPDTIIWTEDGKKTIKEVVDNKYAGRIWSFNPNSKKFELKEIEEYIYNPASRQEIFNISGIECTGEHRVFTQNGAVDARNVKIGDYIIGTSDALYCASGYTKFFSELFLPLMSVAYFCNFVFGKCAWFFKSVFGNTSNSAVSNASFKTDNQGVWQSVFCDKSLDRVCVSSNSFCQFCRKAAHITNKGKMAVLLGIIVVFPIRTVFQVIKRIIHWVIVKMANNATLRSWTNKCFKNKLMNSINLMITRFTKRYLGVSAAGISCADKSARQNTKYPASIRNTVKAFIANNILKYFVHNITSVKKTIKTTETYCVSVKDNHTLIIGETQGLIFGNCHNDFAGWVEKNEPDEWEWFIVPAIDEVGNSYYESRYPIEELRRLEKQNPYMFAAMYQQKPVENYGSYFHEEWIRTFRANPEKFDKIFITTDFGFTTDGDKSLFTCWGKAKDNNLYLLRSRVGKWESPDAKRYCIEFFRHCRAAFPQCRRVYVEQTLSGIGFIQDMRRECPDMAIVPLKRGAKKNKLNRAESAMTWMEGGRVYFRESDPNFVGARAEFLAYNPTDKNPKDEWIDCTGDACEIGFNDKVGSIFL